VRPGQQRAVSAAWYAFTALYCAFVLGWLLLGLAAALTKHLSAMHAWAAAAEAGRQGAAWASAGAGLLAGAGRSYPAVDVILDYVFSAVNVLFAAILFGLARRDWTVRWLVIGMLGAAGAFNLQAHTAIDAMATTSGVQIGWWHSALLHGLGGVAYVLALMLFPTGTLGWAGRRAWPVRALLAASVAGAAALLSVSTAEYPHTLSFVLFFGLLTPIAGVTAQLARYRRAATAEARQQSRILLWALGFAFAAALVLTVVTLTTQGLHLPGPPPLYGVNRSMPGEDGDLFGLGRLGSGSQAAVFWIFRAVFTMIPFAIMAGVLRFRLWDVERVFNRTLIYGVLITMIGAVYVFGVVQTDTLFGLSKGWASAPQIIAAGLIALAFQPVRAWVGRLADRLVYGRRKPAHDVLAEVSAISQASEPGAAALGVLARTVAEGLGVAAASVVLGLPGGTSVTSRWPEAGTADGEADTANGGAGASHGGPETAAVPERRIPVSYRGEHVGALCLPGAPEGSLAPDRRALLNDLAGRVGVILHNASLSIQLEHRLHEIEARSAELRASRLRIVATQDSERRDLERDLHDGAQPGLTAVRLALGLASHMGQVGNIAGARRALDELPGHINEALARLHQALRGLDPQIFSVQGLGEALRDQAAALGARPLFRLAAEGTVEGDTALAPQVGAAVYFCCTEALQNTVKHCPGGPVEVTVELDTLPRRLCFSIADQGPGFDAEAIEGGGLQNMADRIGAVGGEVRVISGAGTGTQVTGWVPIAQATSEASPGATPAATSGS
jgi:signal transduction histidine kinase